MLVAGVNEFSEIEHFAVDWRKKFYGKPLAVLFPKDVNEVSCLITLVNRTEGLSIVPQGGNTGLAGGATPNREGNQLIVSLKRLNLVRAVDSLNKSLIAEAGCTLIELQRVIAKSKLSFPLDFSSRNFASLGGLLATNAGGLSVLKYGTAKEFCLGLEVVLPDGEIWNGLKTLRKDNSGYSLKDLFIGSEGTLGVITAASMRLFSPVEEKITYIVKTPNLASAIELFGQICHRTQDNILAFEFMEKDAIDLVRRHFPERVPHFFKQDTNYVACIVEFPATYQRGDCDINSLSDVFWNKRICSYQKKCSDKEGKEVWYLRESITFASAKDGPQVKNDISLPISKIPDFVKYITRKFNQLYPHGAFINFGHIGDGNLHFNFAPFFNKLPPEGKGKAAEIADFIQNKEESIRGLINDAVVLYDGSITAEHGIGRLRKSENIRLKSDVELEMMRRIKYSLDPRNILNPEVLF